MTSGTSSEPRLQTEDEEKEVESWVVIHGSHIDARELERQVNQSPGRPSLLSRIRRQFRGGMKSLFKEFKVKISALFESDTPGKATVIRIHNSNVSTNYITVVPRDTLQIPPNYCPPTSTSTNIPTTRTDSSSVTATRTDSSSVTATRTDSSSITATRTDSSSITATRTDSSSVIATRTVTNHHSCSDNPTIPAVSYDHEQLDNLQRALDAFHIRSTDEEVQSTSELLPVHTMVFPMLNNPAIADAIRTVEQTNHVAVGILQRAGNPIRISELASTLKPSGSLLRLYELNNFTIPCTPTGHRKVWVAENAQGDYQFIRPDLNRCLNDWYNQHSDKTDFMFNGVQYVIDFQADTVTEVSSGIVQQLHRQAQPVSWSYLVPTVGYVAHETRDSEAIEQVYQYGGDCILLAGSQHTFNFDPSSMCQIDLTTGNRVELRREPMSEVSALPQYNIVLAISGLPEDVNNAKCQLEQILHSTTHSMEVTGIPQVECAQQLILHKARQYCIHVSELCLIENNGAMCIRLEGDEHHVNTIHAHLSQWCTELQAQRRASNQVAPSQTQNRVPQQPTSGSQNQSNHASHAVQPQNCVPQHSNSTSGSQNQSNHASHGVQPQNRIGLPQQPTSSTPDPRGAYVDSPINRKLGRVGLPRGTCVLHKDGTVTTRPNIR